MQHFSLCYNNSLTNKLLNVPLTRMSDILVARLGIIHDRGLHIMTKSLATLLGLLIFTFGLPANAQQAKDFGDYSIHYNAFTTDMLTADVAKAYNITRSKNRALLNISVLKKVMGTSVQPVRARVEVTATNLSSQLKSFDMRELSDQGAIYYIAEAPVANRELLRFNLAVTPEGEPNTYTFSFQQEFFTN